MRHVSSDALHTNLLKRPNVIYMLHAYQHSWYYINMDYIRYSIFQLKFNTAKMIFY